MEIMKEKPIILVDSRRWYGLSGYPALIHCLTCGLPLGSLETVYLGDYFFRHVCGQTYDVRPIGFYRKPTYVVHAKTLPNGRVVRKRLPLADSPQLDLFGGDL